MRIERRDFLATMGMASLSVGWSHSWLAAWLEERTGHVVSEPLVIVLLRGGWDAARTVRPRDDAGLSRLTRVTTPSRGCAYTALDGDWEMHAALQPLLPLWQRGTLAFLPAVGHPADPASHLDALMLLEYGCESGHGGRGWLARALASMPRMADPRVVVCATRSQPALLAGHAPVLSLAGAPAARGAATSGYPPGHLGAALAGIAAWMGLDAGLDVAVAESGGWDHHTDHVAALDRQLKGLADALAAFVRDIGSRYARTLIVVVNEFGRSLRVNERGGTEHGGGGLCMLLGGRVRGGVHGHWPDLSSVPESRPFLPVANDVRGLFVELLEQRLHVLKPGSLFPDLPARAIGAPRILRA